MLCGYCKELISAPSKWKPLEESPLNPQPTGKTIWVKIYFCTRPKMNFNFKHLVLSDFLSQFKSDWEIGEGGRRTYFSQICFQQISFIFNIQILHGWQNISIALMTNVLTKSHAANLDIWDHAINPKFCNFVLRQSNWN